MRNFAIHFQHPWLLLLLIPAFALTVVLYLCINKRFRNTRNRIVSIVLHSLVMVLCIFALSGIFFTYEEAHLENEILLLVDVSETEEQSAERRDEFIQTVISECGYDGYKVGVVTFGFDQRYAVPLTYDAKRVFKDYVDAEKPDGSATNIAAALRFVLEENLFERPETAKIVLITDGKETDETATSVIGSIAKKGITVDTVYISSDFEEDIVQVTGVTYPDHHLRQNEKFSLGVRLQARYADYTYIELFDNGESSEGMSQWVDLSAGDQTVTFSVAFETQGLHRISVKLSSWSDGFTSNNEFSSYYYLEMFSNILIVEHVAGESQALKKMIETDEVYKDSVDILNLSDYASLPQTVDDLRQYDQIILNNISNADMSKLPVPETVEDDDGKDWFVKMLYSYVYDYGGGLFTVGGKDVNGSEVTAHAYNRLDLRNTLFQEMLPVQAIDYTPPVAVMLIIDVSGSMAGQDQKPGDEVRQGTPLFYAQEGAYACLDALTVRDYVGIMTLDSNYAEILSLTRVTENATIRRAISDIRVGSATVFSDAIKTAGERLRQQKNVDKRHIVIVSDGRPGEEEDKYLSVAKELYQSYGITISFAGIDLTGSYYDAMKKMTDAAGGRTHTSSGDQLKEEMRSDINAPEMKESSNEDFAPIVADELSYLFNGVEYGTTSANRRAMDVKLGGFFGTRKRESADVMLMGDYEVPIYAQWKFGNGMIGSFMCDLDGSDTSWSKAFMADTNGQRFLFNVISNLMPIENLRPSDIRLELKESNYINQLSIFTTLEEGQKIKGKIIEMTDDGEIEYGMDVIDGADEGIYVTSALGEGNRYSRCSFVVKRSGGYKIVVEKYDENDAVISSFEFYKSFAYSAEYDSFIEYTFDEDLPTKLASLAEQANGNLIDGDDPWSIFSSFVTTLDRTYDPRLPFMIAAIVLFLLDIAVRKFKFKWIHELVREHKAKKADTK